MGNNKKHYRIVLIEPSPIIAAGVQELLKPYREFEIVAIAADGYHYAEHVRNQHPDIVIINPSVIDLQHKAGTENSITGLDIPLVALVYQYIKPENLKRYRTIIDISDDCERIVKKLYQSIEIATDQPEGNELSEREKEILISVAKGMINKEIAELHHISIHTVITHRKNITRKTGIKSVSGLTVYAILNNLITMNEVE